MALYEEDSMVLRNPGEQAPEGYILKGRMGPVGEEQDYYERASSPTVGQKEQPQGFPAGGDINQFLDWVIKTKIGFNPFEFNPTTEAMKTWKQNEAELFNATFANTGITPQSMTPDALKHWNAQRKEGLAAFIQEAQQKQQNAVAYLKMLADGWQEYNTVAGRLELPTGEKLLVNKFGQGIRNAQAMEQGGVQPQTKGGFLTEPVKTPAPSAQERKRMMDEANLLKMSDDIMVQLKPDDKGVIPAEDWTGPIKGRYGQISEKVRDLPPAQVNFYATIRDMNDFVLRVRSGAQINEQEYKRLTSFLADPNLPTNNLRERIKRFRDNLKWMRGLEEREFVRPTGQAPSQERTVIKKQRNTKTGQIKTIYSDGSEEIE